MIVPAQITGNIYMTIWKQDGSD